MPVSILIEPSKKGNRKEGWKGDKGFVRNRDRSLSTFRDVDVWFFQPVVVRDSKVTSGTIILPRIPKFTAILIKVSTLRGWNGGGPIGSHFLRHEDDRAPATLIHGEPSFVTEIATRLAGGFVRSVQRKSNVNCHRSILLAVN